MMKLASKNLKVIILSVIILFLFIQNVYAQGCAGAETIHNDIRESEYLEKELLSYHLKRYETIKTDPTLPDSLNKLAEVQTFALQRRVENIERKHKIEDLSKPEFSLTGISPEDAVRGFQKTDYRKYDFEEKVDPEKVDSKKVWEIIKSLQVGGTEMAPTLNIYQNSKTKEKVVLKEAISYDLVAEFIGNRIHVLTGHLAPQMDLIMHEGKLKLAIEYLEGYSDTSELNVKSFVRYKNADTIFLTDLLLLYVDAHPGNFMHNKNNLEVIDRAAILGLNGRGGYTPTEFTTDVIYDYQLRGGIQKVLTGLSGLRIRNPLFDSLLVDRVLLFDGEFKEGKNLEFKGDKLIGLKEGLKKVMEISDAQIDAIVDMAFDKLKPLQLSSDASPDEKSMIEDFTKEKIKKKLKSRRDRLPSDLELVSNLKLDPINKINDEPMLESANPELLKKALDAFSNNLPVTDEDIEILLKQAVFDDRNYFIDNYGSEKLTACEMTGVCGLGQADLFHRINILGKGKLTIRIHQAAKIFGNQHAFLVVTLDGHNSYLVDTTYRQFFVEGNLPGELLKQIPESYQTIQDLLRKGYGKLTPELIKYYGGAFHETSVAGVRQYTIDPKELTEKSTDSEVDVPKEEWLNNPYSDTGPLELPYYYKETFGTRTQSAIITDLASKIGVDQNIIIQQIADWESKGKKADLEAQIKKILGETTLLSRLKIEHPGKDVVAGTIDTMGIIQTGLNKGKFGITDGLETDAFIGKIETKLETITLEDKIFGAINTMQIEGTFSISDIGEAKFSSAIVNGAAKQAIKRYKLLKATIDNNENNVFIKLGDKYYRSILAPEVSIYTGSYTRKVNPADSNKRQKYLDDLITRENLPIKGKFINFGNNLDHLDGLVKEITNNYNVPNTPPTTGSVIANPPHKSWFEEFVCYFGVC